jgi:hypothetical protein
MKLRILFSKSGMKSGKEKEKDTTINNVDGVDEQDELTNTARARPNTSDGLGLVIWFTPEPSMEPIAEYVSRFPKPSSQSCRAPVPRYNYDGMLHTFESYL